MSKKSTPGDGTYTNGVKGGGLYGRHAGSRNVSGQSSAFRSIVRVIRARRDRAT
jgi:hypothetical protein